MESFSELLKGQEEKNNVIQCTVIRKFNRGKNEFLKVDAGMKTEGVVNLKEFEIEPLPGDKVDLVIVEVKGNELVMSARKVKFEYSLNQLKELQKSKNKISVTIKDKTSSGYKVAYEGIHGILHSHAPLKDKVEVYIAKVFKDGFYCFTDMKKPRTNVVRSSVVDCEIEKKDDFYAFLKIKGQDKLEGIINIEEIKSDRDIKAQIVYVEGIKAILSTIPIKKLEMKKVLNKLQISHENSLRVSGTIISTSKEGAQVKVGELLCRVSIKDLFWTSSIYDPKIDIQTFQSGEKYDFHVRNMTLYWKANELSVSAEAQYGISTLLENFHGEILDNSLKVGDSIFNLNQKATPGNYEFVLDTIQLNLKTASLNPYIAFEKKYPEGTLVQGTVTSDPYNRREIFVDVDGVSCQLSQSEINWDFTAGKNRFNTFKIGDKLEAVVKNIDLEKSFVSLTMKAPRGDEFYGALRNLQKNRVHSCKVEEIILNQFKKPKKIRITIANDPKYEGIFGFIMREEFSSQKRVFVGDIISAKFIKMYNQELLFSQKSLEEDENARVAKMIEQINEGENESFSFLEEHFNLF
jgi:small subunit ribosomal protein S1